MTPVVPLGPGSAPLGAVAVSVQAVGATLPCTSLTSVRREMQVTVFVMVYELAPAASVAVYGSAR